MLAWEPSLCQWAKCQLVSELTHNVMIPKLGRGLQGTDLLMVILTECMNPYPVSESLGSLFSSCGWFLCKGICKVLHMGLYIIPLSFKCWQSQLAPGLPPGCLAQASALSPNPSIKMWSVPFSPSLSLLSHACLMESTGHQSLIHLHRCANHSSLPWSSFRVLLKWKTIKERYNWQTATTYLQTSTF